MYSFLIHRRYVVTANLDMGMDMEMEMNNTKGIKPMKWVITSIWWTSGQVLSRLICHWDTVSIYCICVLSLPFSNESDVHSLCIVEHSCFIATLGEIKCFGDNADGNHSFYFCPLTPIFLFIRYPLHCVLYKGQLGLEDNNDRGDESDEMGDNLPTVDLGTGFDATQLAVFGSTSDHSCGCNSNNQWKCWGYDHCI